LHGIDVYYTIDLPDIFLFVHPVGTVLGTAKYSDYFLVYQNCTIGANLKGDHPILGRYLTVYEGASILGRCNIGKNCRIAAGSMIMDSNLKNNKIYIGNPTDHTIKENSRRSGNLHSKFCK
jgi:serine O-acetyltransferase